MRIVSWLAGIAAGVSLVAGTAVAQQNSGFLGNSYSKLKEAQSPSGQKVKRWIAPGLTPGKFEAVLLDKTVYFPQPKPTEQVSAATLNDISAYMDEALKRELTGVVTLATEPGPKVLRFRPAITAAAPKDAALKPYQVIPIAFIVAKAANNKTASLSMEYEAVDTDTNQVVGAGMREGAGKELKSATEKLTLDMFKPLIDSWAKDARAFVEAAKLKK